jgi:hypothetical protein
MFLRRGTGPRGGLDESERHLSAKACNGGAGDRAVKRHGTPTALQAFLIAVLKRSAPKLTNTCASRSRSSRGTSSVTAAKTVPSTGTHRACLVFATAAETRQWHSGSSMSPR